MPETLEISVRELKTWLEEETSSILEPIRIEGANLLSDTRNRLEELRGSSEKLLENSEKEMLKSSPKTYRRARTAYKFARDIIDTIDEQDIPNSYTYETLQTLRGDLEKSFETIGRERAKRFRLISPYFIFDRRRFDMALKKALDSLKKLRDYSLHGYAEAKAVEDSIVMVDKLLRSLNGLDEIKQRKGQIDSKREIVEKRIGEIEGRIASIGSAEEVSELAQVNTEINKLDETVKLHIRHLQKPFLKFQKLVQGPGSRLPLEETRKLNHYVRNPFEALATEEEGYPQLRRILQGMNDAVAKGKLKLKRSRLRRAQEQINEILNKDALTSLHKSCSQALSRKQQLLATKTVAATKRRQTELEENLNKLKKQRQLADSRMAASERRHKAELESIEQKKRELENALSEITDESIRVML
ncbi:MAG: hypothetical protein JSV57_05875 [Candidatus Bathyarchaeota archaeon]|nr:MAG: hypothetical protein JSV57_05875 [Candidatus Bathyarchaeota archaeon]